MDFFHAGALGRLSRLAGFAGLAGLARLARLARLSTLRLGSLAGLGSLARASIIVTWNFNGIIIISVIIISVINLFLRVGVTFSLGSLRLGSLATTGRTIIITHIKVITTKASALATLALTL